MSFKIFGHVRKSENSKGIADVVVGAFDSDFFSDDLLGEVTTDENGFFSMKYEENRGLFSDRPDIYLVIKTKAGKVLKTTKDNIRLDVDQKIEINVYISHPLLVKAGFDKQEPAQWLKNLDPKYLSKFKTWTLRSGYDETDETIIQLKKDLADKSSVLELMKGYLDELEGNQNNNALPFIKLAKLFESGITPESMEGHFGGVPIAIRSGDLKGSIAEFSNILGFLWGFTFADICPWVGKSFSHIDSTELKALADISASKQQSACLGINHFNRMDFQPLNVTSLQMLNVWMRLENASPSEKAIRGYEKNGGNFISVKAESVYHGSKREVFQLNYRWKNLDNPLPFCWLIDEMVQIAEGMYLGQLLFATRRLQRDYDPKDSTSDFKYQHFGYFILFDETWNNEARRLLPHLELPPNAPGIGQPDLVTSHNVPKFTEFTFEDSSSPGHNDLIFDQVNTDLKNEITIMHLLKRYSNELQNSFDNDSPYFLRLREMFNRGITPDTVEGFYRGGLVSWRTDGLLKFANLNFINLAWVKMGRYFSPWTGKTFESIDTIKLKEITDGHELGEIPTFWGANTQSLRTPKEQFSGKLMRLAGLLKEEVSPEEAREFGYDLKNLFFIARRAKTVNKNNHGKDIFQFNYRWPKLETIPPDCYCIDEIVQIAEGLYLGQLMYATNLLKPYDSQVDPSEYEYRMFGYFLLMDEAWHQVRLSIKFDLGNV